MIYVRNDIQSYEAGFEIYCNYPEVVGCFIAPSTRTRILFVCIYRPESISELDRSNLCQLLRGIPDVECTDVVLCGDFNLPQVDWANFSWPPNVDWLMDALLQTNLTQHVHVPTRKGNVLDLVFTKDDTSAADVQTETPLGKSDHDVVTFSLLCREKQNREKTFAQPCFKKANFAGMKAWLAEELRDLTWDGISVSEMWDNIEAMLKEGIAKFVPHRVPRKRNQKPVWADAYAMRALRLQKNSHREYQRKRTVQSYDRYLMARDIACAAIRKSKELFERRLAENIKQDNKSFWRYLNCRRVAKPSAGPVIDPTLGAPTTNDRQCAEVFNEYFASIFTVEDTNVPLPTSKTDHVLCDSVM